MHHVESKELDVISSVATSDRHINPGFRNESSELNASFGHRVVFAPRTVRGAFITRSFVSDGHNRKPSTTLSSNIGLWRLMIRDVDGGFAWWRDFLVW